MRHPDWQQRLANYLQARTSMPFAWGTNDCCTFAAGAVEAISGRDHAAAFSRYADQRVAARMLRRIGGLRALASSALGEPMSPLMASVGDVVLVKNADRQLLAICNGTSALAPGPHGTVALGMDAAEAAWKV